MFRTFVRHNPTGVIVDRFSAPDRAEVEAWLHDRAAANAWAIFGSVTTEITDITAEIAAAKVNAEAYRADLAALDKFKGKNLTNSEIKQALELFLKILFNENSSLAAELVRFAAKAK